MIHEVIWSSLSKSFGANLHVPPTYLVTCHPGGGGEGQSPPVLRYHSLEDEGVKQIDEITPLSLSHS